MKDSLKPLVKILLIPVGLTPSASVKDAAIHKKIFGSAMTTLIISNEEMNDTWKQLGLSLEESGLFIKGASKTIKNDSNKQKEGFLSMLLGTLGVSLLGNLLTGKGTIRAGESKIRADEGTIKTCQDFPCRLVL